VQGAEEKPLRFRPKACDGTDAARGVLAFIVFVSHFAQIFFGDAYALGLAPSLCVLFFFAISGFVISASLLRHTAKSGAADLVAFAKRRFFRIMPPLMAIFLIIAALEFILVLSGILGEGSLTAGVYGYRLDWPKVTISLLTIGAVGDLGGGVDGPLWSLRYEIRCYLTAAVLAWLLTSRATAGRKAVVVTGLCAYWFVALFVRNESPLSQLPWLLSFAVGFAVFRYRNILVRTGRRGTALALAFAAAACLLTIFAEATNWYLFIMGLCICGCAFAPIVFVLHGVAVRSRALGVLSGMSYTLYIAHFPILLALYLSIKGAPTMLYVPLAAAAAVVTAVGCFALGRLVERPSAQLAWAERQLSRIRTTIAVGAPQA
jgi:peptidoglycan/LPS O-acetylase OafA/YrhL